MNTSIILSGIFGFSLGWFFKTIYINMTPKQKKLIKDKFNNVADNFEGKE
jgi:hypothetical protein